MNTIQQLSLFIENKPGAIGAPCKVLADAGISISTLSLADTKFFGVLRMLIRDWQKAKDLLEKKGFAVKLTDVIAVEVDHTAGSLSKILDILEENGVNVEYMYAYAAGFNGKAVLIFRFDDPESALKKLQGKPGILLVDSDTLLGSELNRAGH